MKNINSIHFINSLAEVTRHQDRELIEKSLLKTLGEYHSSQEYWLYQVLSIEPEISLGLLSYSSKSTIITSNSAKKKDVPTHLEDAITRVIETGKVESVKHSTKDEGLYILYPAIKHNDDVFAVLIERTENLDLDSQRLVHGFLRIYANYLELIEQSRRDKLTGLLNRETLDLEITRVIILNNENISPHVKTEPYDGNDTRQHKGELRSWIGIIDIDHFKKINDTYGHLYGDEILILVSRLMESCVRNYDFVYRYGGEEFVILIKAFDQPAAERAFERIRTTIGHHSYAKVDEITVSIGVTEILTQMGPPSVLAEADQAMYYAKENGRDQLHFYSDLVLNGLLQEPDSDKEAPDISFF
jgi:diguanylate cyclase (GGDEF)-like protein